MSRFSETVKTLKREKMAELQKMIELRRNNNDHLKLYKDSLRINNVNDGMVVIITPNEVIKEKAPRGISHRKVCQDIIDTISDMHIDLGKVDGDFGNVIPREYGYVFIRMASVLNGSTIIYYPDKCNEFQIEKLTEFNNIVKEYNASKRDEFKVTFEYNGKNDTEYNNLDELIKTLNSNRISRK